MKQFIYTALLGMLFITTRFAGMAFIPDENFNLGGSKKGLIIMPNPITGDVQVLFAAKRDGAASVKVYNASGNIVLTLSKQLVAGKNRINIDNSIKLEDGNYKVQLITNNKIYRAVFVVWK
jgi:hypothetical protein